MDPLSFEQKMTRSLFETKKTYLDLLAEHGQIASLPLVQHSFGAMTTFTIYKDVSTVLYNNLIACLALSFALDVTYHGEKRLCSCFSYSHD
jgi:hypothetical protein